MVAVCTLLLVALVLWLAAVPKRSNEVPALPVINIESPRVLASQPLAPSPTAGQNVPAASQRPVTRPQAPELPFSFLGRVTEGGESTIVLHGSGRTLKVRGIGPIDDNYVVEHIRDDHLVLRHLPTGAEQALGLESRNYGVMMGASAADTPQD